MLNSKMKRSMAWIMSAAMIMSAAPVSAADFTAEADVEVTAEAADVVEENTDAPEAEAEEDGGFGSGEMISEENTAESGSDENGLTDEENAGDESADFMDGFSDGSAEEEGADVSDGFIDEGMSTEELLQAYAEGATDVEAPYSSVEKLDDGEYTGATVNAFIAGEDNDILGVNAYMTNPKNPAAIGGLENEGTPTEPMYNNATVKVINGVPTVTLELKNPVFQLLEMGIADNATIVEGSIKRGTEITDQNEYGTPRITEITLQLKDFSGLYVFNNSVEYGTVLNDNNPDTDDRWYKPLYVSIDFEELLPENTIANKIWTDDDTNIGLWGRGKDLSNKELKVEKITEGEVYDEYQKLMVNNKNTFGSSDNMFYLYKVSLMSNGEEYTQTSKDKFSLLFNFINDFEITYGDTTSIQAYVMKNGTLERLSMDTASYDEMDNGWQSPLRFTDMQLGYVVFCKNGYAVKSENNFENKALDLVMTFYSDETGVNTDPTWPNNSVLKKSRLVSRSLKNEANANFDSIINQVIQKGFVSDSSEAYIDSAYGIWLESLINGQYQYTKASTNHTGQTLILPVENAEKADYQFYILKMNGANCEGVIARNSEIVDDNHIKVDMYPIKNAQSNSVAQEQYAGAMGDISGKYRILALVRKIKQIEKPSVNVNLIYTGEVLTGINGGEGYTIEGNTAKLPGKYTAKATLKDGYAWTDGTTDPVEFDWTIKALQTEKPVAISGLTYNGESQTGVKAGTGYNLAGTYTAKDAGTYNAKVLLADGYEWSDGTTDALTLTWSIAKKAVAKPAAAKDLVYNGKSQTGVTAGEGYTVTGNTQTDAGDYTAVAALDKNYVWADGTTDSAKVAWSIAKKTVAKPAAAANLVYTGSEQTGVTAGEGYTVTGNTQTNAGSYAAVATLDKNHAWTDGTTAPATVQWTIAKAAQNVTAKTASKSYKIATVKKKAQSFTIGAAANGTLTYKVIATPSKKAAKYLTVTKNGKVTVKKGAPAGTYTITVSAAETANNLAASTEVTVTVNKTSQKVTAKVSSKTIKSKQIAKKNATFTIGANGKGKLTYKVTSTPKKGAKYISVTKNGKVTVKKKAPKGTYKITVTAAGNATYAKATKTITVKVK